VQQDDGRRGGVAPLGVMEARAVEKDGVIAVHELNCNLLRSA
jgi:hypothetical protein